MGGASHRGVDQQVYGPCHPDESVIARRRTTVDAYAASRKSSTAHWIPLRGLLLKVHAQLDLAKLGTEI